MNDVLCHWEFNLGVVSIALLVKIFVYRLNTWKHVTQGDSTFSQKFLKLLDPRLEYRGFLAGRKIQVYEKMKYTT